jgi:hypothetical protein
VYVMPKLTPRIFNIKWDRDHTRYAGAPIVPAVTPAVARPAARVAFPPSASISFRRRPSAVPCKACQCAGGMSKKPTGMGGLYGLGYNSATSYIYTKENPAVVQQVAQGMIGEGYNAQIVNSLVAGGATSGDLQNLWDNYTPSTNANDPDGFGLPALRLLQAITAAHPAPVQYGSSGLNPFSPQPIFDASQGPVPNSMTYSQALAQTPAYIAQQVKDAASSLWDDVASAFVPAAGRGFSIPWWAWAIGGAGLLVWIEKR